MTSRLFGSIKQRILVLFITIVLVITLIILAIVGFLSHSLVKDLLEQNATSVVQGYARSIQTWRQERVRELSKLAEADILKESRWDEMEPLLQGQMENTDQYYRIYFVAEKDGSYNTTLRSPAGNIADRSYFAQVMGGETVISEPLVSRSTGEKIVVLAAPIWNDTRTEVVRLLGLGVGLTEIYQTIAGLKHEHPDWDIYLIDENGRFITHQNPGFILDRSLSDFHPQWGDLRIRDSGTFTYSQDGVEYRAFLSEIPHTPGWTVVTKLPTAYYKRPLKRLIYFSLIASGLGLLLVLRLGFWFAGTITAPIVELKEVFRRGSEGDLTVRAEVASADEFGDTRIFFNRMMDTIGTMTYLDPLTKLPNRHYFLSELGNCLNHNPTVVLALISIRGLAELKTLLRPEVVDEILIETANALNTMGGGKKVVGRVAEAEFGLFAPSGTGGVLQLIDRLNDLFSHPLSIEGSDVEIRLFGGVTIGEHEALSAEAFFQQAQTALYDAEHDSVGTVKLYNPDIHHAIMDKLRFQTEIRNALLRRQFTVYYQPIIRLESRQIVGKEALIRWNHPVRGLLQPGEFLPAAEQGGFMEQIGEYMLEEVCRQHRLWQKQGLVMGRAAVNISASHFRSPNFPQVVSTILQQYSLPASFLQIEITEDTMLSPTAAVLNNLGQLQRLGVDLAIDDFGTAYSTLDYLVRYPMEILKVDRTFIDLLDQNLRTEGLVRSIIGMGRNLSMSIVAEGVERPKQLELLVKMRCTEAQGYYFSRPVPWRDYPEMVRGLNSRLVQNGFFR